MLLVKEKTYTFKEFSEMMNEKKYTKEERLMKQYANECGTNLIIPADYLTDKELAEYRKLDREVGIMMKNPKTRKLLVTLTACLLHCSVVFADVATATKKMNEVGGVVFGLCQTASYWLCLISCGIEIARCIATGDSKSIAKVIPKYILGFGGIYFLPFIFDLIKDIFG